MRDDEQLAAIRERDATVSDWLIPHWNDLITRHRMPAEQAIIDRRSLLAYVDRLREACTDFENAYVGEHEDRSALREALVAADSIMSLIRYRRGSMLTDVDRADLDAAISTCRRLT